MGERLRTRARRVAMVLLVVAAGMVTQGCILESKEVIDVYDLAFGIPAGGSLAVNRMTFPIQYCIPESQLILSAAFGDPIANLTRLAVIAIILASGGTEVDRFTFLLPLRSDGSFRKRFDVPAFCIEPGQTVVWRIRPNAAIPFGQRLITRLFVGANDL
jgi:hypothetical protein